VRRPNREAIPIPGLENGGRRPGRTPPREDSSMRSPAGTAGMAGIPVSPSGLALPPGPDFVATGQANDDVPPGNDAPGSGRAADSAGASRAERPGSEARAGETPARPAEPATDDPARSLAVAARTAPGGSG
jgi:hypothetical protein